MRTTVTIDDDLAVRLDRGRTEQHKTFKDYLNEVIRAGLDAQSRPKPPRTDSFRTQPLPLGHVLVDNLDNIAEVLAIAEGDDYR